MRKGPSQEEDVWMRQTCSWLRDDRKDWFTVAQLKAAKCKHVFSFNKAESKEHVDKLVLAGKLLAASAVLITEDAVPQTGDENMFFPEEYHVPSIRRRLAPDSSKSLKLTTLSHFYRRRHQPEGGAKKRGAPRRRANPDAEESELAGKLTDFLDKDLLMFNRVERVLAESGDKESPVPETVVMQREYFYPLETRCSSLAPAICCPDTVDYDIPASMFSIVVKLVDLGKPANLQLPCWRAVAEDRAGTCRKHLDCSAAADKQTLMEVAKGAATSKFCHLGKDALRFLEESRQLRWLACCQMQGAYKDLRQHSKNHWPEATIFANWWTSAEDYILFLSLLTELIHT
eukprot:s1740_g11.t1